MNTTVLIIEDDAEINDMLRILLQQNGYRTVSAYSGTEALLIQSGEIGCILLDLMLPGRSGEEIIRELKQKHGVPVIVMSAIHDVEKKVNLFSLGADDYITKPFHNDELLARIAARLRSPDGSKPASALTFRDLVLDTEQYTVTCAGKTVELSRHEFALLRLLMEHPDRTCKTAKRPVDV